jgi:phage terminase small subunit
VTPREEKFARLVVEGKSQSEAFRTVYPHSKRWKQEAVHVCASQLASKVRLRINAMQDEAKERALLTLEDHMAKLQELRDLAAASETFAPAITAEVKRGELMGYYVARSENVNTNFVISGSPDDDDATADPEDWTARHRPN